MSKNTRPFKGLRWPTFKGHCRSSELTRIDLLPMTSY